MTNNFYVLFVDILSHCYVCYSYEFQMINSFLKSFKWLTFFLCFVWLLWVIWLHELCLFCNLRFVLVLKNAWHQNSNFLQFFDIKLCILSNFNIKLRIFPDPSQPISLELFHAAFYLNRDWPDVCFRVEGECTTLRWTLTRKIDTSMNNRIIFEHNQFF